MKFLKNKKWIALSLVCAMAFGSLFALGSRYPYVHAQMNTAMSEGAESRITDENGDPKNIYISPVYPHGDAISSDKKSAKMTGVYRHHGAFSSGSVNTQAYLSLRILGDPNVYGITPERMLMGGDITIPEKIKNTGISLAVKDKERTEMVYTMTVTAPDGYELVDVKTSFVGDDLTPNFGYLEEFGFERSKLVGKIFIEATLKPEMKDQASQTKVNVKVVYKYADEKIYKFYDMPFDIGYIIDASDLPMLPDEMSFNDDFMFYEVKPQDNEIIRVLASNSTDNGTQTDNPGTTDNGTQTENPGTTDNGTQTENPGTTDNGTQTDNPGTTDNGTQTENPGTTDNGTQTENPGTTDNGTQTDNPGTTDNGTQTENPGTTDNGTQTDNPGTTDNGTQTDDSNGTTNDKGTQTDKTDTRDQGTQTDGTCPANGNNACVTDRGTQTDDISTSDASTQTDLTMADIEKLEKDAEKLKERITELEKQLKDKTTVTNTEKTVLEKLTEEIQKLRKELEECKRKNSSNNGSNTNSGNSNSNTSSTGNRDSQTRDLKDLDKLVQQLVDRNKGLLGKVGLSDTYNKVVKELPKTNSGNPGKDQEISVRFPNKLNPKAAGNPNGNAQNGSDKKVTTKGVASPPSKARGTVTENVDNGNKEYPIHHGDCRDCENEDDCYCCGKNITRQYSADARQFLTFTTKSGKTFHLIINHDEQSENVMLLTEVDEDDLLNMVEAKTKKDAHVVEDKPEAPKPTAPVDDKKKEDKGGIGMYLLVILVLLGAGGAAYYFKVLKKKDEDDFEEQEDTDEFYSEAEEPEADDFSEETYEESKSGEDENSEDQDS